MARVLLIEDDEAVLTANRAALQARGHLVFEARGATEALSAIEEVKPDAAVLEPLVVGLSSGFEFADRLALALGHRPLLLLSRADEVLDAKTRRQQDRDGWTRAVRFLEKPVPPERLAEELEHVLAED